MTGRRRRLRRARARLATIRATLGWVEDVAWFYNLDNYREPKQVAAEIGAILKQRPALLGLVECIGNRLPKIHGYRLVADDSTKSRANIAAYVRDDLPLNRTRWVDLTGTWPRTKGSGIHEARSYLVLDVGRVQVAVAHQPPKNARHSWGLQLEGVDALVGVMAPWRSQRWRRRRVLPVRVIARLRPRMLLWDANRRIGESGPGPDMLARQIGGEVHGGRRIDHAVTRGQVEVTSVRKLGRVGAVTLESDHQGAIRIRWRVRAFWLNRKENR